MSEVVHNLRDGSDAQMRVTQFGSPNRLERQGIDLLLTTPTFIPTYPAQNGGTLDLTPSIIALANRNNPGNPGGDNNASMTSRFASAAAGVDGNGFRTAIMTDVGPIDRFHFRAGTTSGEAFTGQPQLQGPTDNVALKDGGVAHRTNGLITSLDKGNSHIEFQYQMGLNGQLQRDDKGNPILSAARITENGRASTFNLQDIAKNGDNVGRANFLNKLGMDGNSNIKLDHFSVEQNGDFAGKISATTDDGSKAIYGLFTRPDGTVDARIERQEKTTGLVREFEYNNAGDPSQTSAFTDRYKTAYGKEVVERSERIGNSDRFVMKDGDGKVVYARDVHVDAGGDVVYRRDDEDTRLMESIFGPSWLRRGDMKAAKEHLLEVAGGHYKGGRSGLEHDLNAMEQRMQAQEKIDLPKVTDDQIGSIYRSLASVYDKGHTSALSDAERTKSFARAVASLRNPYENNMQGQIGSCYLNSILMVAEFGHPDMVANAWASAVTTGKFKGKTFNHYDLTGTANQDSFNHTLTSFLGKTFGFSHMTPGFRGTCEDEARKAYKQLTGKTFKIGNHMSAAERDKAIKRDGGVVWYTMGGGHAQCGTHDWRKSGGGKEIVEVRENTWYLHDGKVLRTVKKGLEA
ncbi:MAG TPA: hypothetical protein V6C69_10225 [Trichormus sp.]